MEELSHDIVELILERVPAKSLLRFKLVSKQWRSTIESNNFVKRQMIRRKQSRDTDIIFVYNDADYHKKNILPSSSSSSSSSSSVIPILFPIKKRFRCTASCDGLVCFYNGFENIVINPTTRWQRDIPLSKLQRRRSRFASTKVFTRLGLLGFGKDRFNGTYKPVWLYNNPPEFGSLEDYKNTITTCEVFDFSINAWRYVTPPSLYKIISNVDPAYVDGSLHWLTKYESGIKVLSFDLHTETFHVIAEAPSDKAQIHYYHMCNLNNRLCVSEKSWSNQVIWLFDSESKTWDHLHTIDTAMTYSWFRNATTYEMKLYAHYFIHLLKPLAVLEEKNEKTKVLYSFHFHKKPGRHFVIYDGQTRSFSFAFSFNSSGYPLCYFQSLISIL